MGYREYIEVIKYDTGNIVNEIQLPLYLDERFKKIGIDNSEEYVKIEDINIDDFFRLYIELFRENLYKGIDQFEATYKVGYVQHFLLGAEDVLGHTDHSFFNSPSDNLLASSAIFFNTLRGYMIKNMFTKEKYKFNFTN